jgi:hypothetical protein
LKETTHSLGQTSQIPAGPTETTRSVAKSFERYYRVYEELLGNGLTEFDPFTDSEEAVEAWEEGDFESLVRHNVTYIRRTRALMRLAEWYCSKSHFTMRSLDPVA